MADFLAGLPGGWGWLMVAVVAAGMVRGFSGFGTAMVYLPVAGQVLSPFEALTTLILIDMFGPLPNVPRALRDGHPGDILRLGAGALCALPLGVAVLAAIPAEAFRWAVSLIALTLLVLLVSGVRYRGALSRPLIVGTGAIGGFLAGSVGLPGPPVIMLYMASTLPVAAIRANLLLYLLLTDILFLGVMAVSGHLVMGAVGLGLMLMPVYVLANIAGAAIFRPEGERVYRAVAYVIIAGAALSGLPLFD